ncbi:carboxypeptidase-like regulatory domain-containing protein [Pedobacter sp. KBW01]|uniref:carboxypeptidase-like regulatory domain-containing protein n=1 Tax=Pedobacter sp. KBW01 TaxID=2153364 RepID=UPI000F599E4E|nr:carboxypeptidase-like regulatory domain-containing protein [Pedobacter sp. KBW01]
MPAKFTSILYLLFFCLTGCLAQNANAQSVAAQSGTTNFQERVHLHMDKSFYLPGDTIWFKAYVVDEANLPSKASGTLYVDLINEKDSLLNGFTLPLLNGVSFGNAPIDIKSSKGLYRLRAYTRIMDNITPVSFFDQVIKIGDVEQIKNQITAIQDIDVRFLPEGGNLLMGLPSRIAYKAVSRNGRGVNITGRVLNSKETEMCLIQDTYQGMGSFFFTAEEGITYKAIVKVNGAERAIDLPLAQSSGYTLAVSQRDTSELVIKSMCTKDLIGKGELKLSVHKNGVELLSIPFVMDSQMARITVPAAKLPQGIVQISLLAAKGQPLCERLAFIGQGRNNDVIKQNGLAIEYPKRGETKLELQTMVDGGPVTNGSFSVAVTNSEVSIPNLDNESHILADLLLSPDLKGHIENPNRYFMDSSDSTRMHLDNLMLTQGWRKISWQKKYNPEKTIQITGKVTDKKGGVLAANVTLMRTGKELGLEQTVTDSLGRFSFDLVYMGLGNFVVQAKSDKSKWLAVKLDSLPAIPISPNSFTKNYFKDTLSFLSKEVMQKNTQKYLKQEGIKLKEVEIKGSRKLDYNPSREPINSGHVFQVILQKDLIHVEDIMDYLARHLRGNGVIAMNDYGVMKPMYPLYIKGMNTIKMMPISVSINDFPVDEYFDLSALPVKEIEKIQVYLLGSPPHPSIMTISMKDKNILYQNFRKGTPPGTAYLKQEGYTISKAFYEVKYPLKKQSNEEDLRTTLYWAPNLIPDKNGKISVSYFNGDLTGKHRVVLEGFDGQGNLFRKEWNYNVVE